MKFIALLVLAVVVTGCQPADSAEDSAVQRAYDVTTDLIQYAKFGGRNLEMVDVAQERCHKCYTVRYRFEYDSQRLKDAIEIASVEVLVQGSRVIMTRYEERLKNIVTFADCVDAGYDVYRNDTTVCVTPEGREIKQP